MKHKTSQSGFTLIELIAVMVILGILAAVLIPRLTTVQASAYEVNAKQMYHALNAHINMMSQRDAISGGHGLETFIDPDPLHDDLNYYIQDWMDDYDSEHWTQIFETDGGDDVDGDAQDALYFIYHPHETWTGANIDGTDLSLGDGGNGITIEKDLYYISYFPLQNAEGLADGIPDNEYHLALRKDNSDRTIEEAANADEVVDDLFHCGGDNNPAFGAADEAGVGACARH